MKKLVVRHILVIRFRRVGDSVLSMGLCHSLRQTFPDAQIDFVINEGIHTLYEHHPDVDRCITFNDEENHNSRLYLKKVWKTVHDTRYDVIIDMRTTVKTLWFSLFSRYRTPYRIGIKKGYGWGILSHRVDNHAKGTGNRLVQNNMLMNPLAEIAELKKSNDFRLYVEEERKQQFRQLMEEKNIDFSRPVILATPTARLEYKVLPAESMKEILHKIIGTFDAQIIFNFAGKERDIALRYQHEMGDDPHIFTNIEAPSLPDLCALASNCHYFFGNEGGPRHIAQALNVPSFAIFPPNIKKSVWLPNEGERFAGISPDDFVPYEEQISKKMSYTERMALLTPERIWKQLEPHMRGNLFELKVNS